VLARVVQYRSAVTALLSGSNAHYRGESPPPLHWHALAGVVVTGVMSCGHIITRPGRCVDR
jgi:hypothetical protein